MTTIVVSAVNIRKGGTLTICRQCLQYLSTLASTGDYRIVALVHSRALYTPDNIEYIELPDTVRGWGRRLWCEYVTMKRISRQLAPIDLWLSMHDTTPRVEARRQAVYCQTSFPFLRLRGRDFRMDKKIPLFAMFTRLAYRFNVKANRYLIVQQQWLREGLSRMLGVTADRFIVARPQRQVVDMAEVEPHRFALPTFFYASTADCHKNFELLCSAAQQLEAEVGCGRFRVVITVKGDENRYARWLHRQWGDVDSITFAGLMDRRTLTATYAGADCLVFPSRVETWGLPITEYLEAGGKHLMLADLPYAHETAAGAESALFFNPNDTNTLKEQMRHVIDGDYSLFGKVPDVDVAAPAAPDWQALFALLLN